MLASRRPYFSRLGTHLAIRLEMTALLPLSCRVQNVLVMPVLLLRLTLMSFLGRPPRMPSRFHILDVQLLPGLDGDRVAGVPLGPPELNSTIMAAPAESC